MEQRKIKRIGDLMKASDLKKALKPVILECLREILAEEFIRKVTAEEVVATLSESKKASKKEVVQENRHVNVNVPTSSIRETLRNAIIGDSNPYEDDDAESVPTSGGVSYSNTDPNFGRQYVSKQQLTNIGLDKKDWSKYKF